MRRGYSREAFLELMCKVKDIIPGVQLSGDMIAGFCGETEEDFLQTLSLMEEVEYNTLYTFAYSLREKTHAHRKLSDDVPQDVKLDRVRRMTTLHRKITEKLNKKLIGTQQLVLIEGDSKRSSSDYQGRTDGYTKVILPKLNIDTENELSRIKPGDYCQVEILDASSEVLFGRILNPTTIQNFYQNNYEVLHKNEGSRTI